MGSNAMDELLAALHSAATHIRSSCTAPATANLEATTTISACGNAITSLLARQATQILALHTPPSSATSVDEPLLRQRLADLLSLADSRLLAFRFEILPPCWRELYAHVRILFFHLGVLRSRLRGGLRDAAASEEVDGLVRELDMGLIVAGGGSRWGKGVINSLLGLLERAWKGGSAPKDTDGRGPKRLKRTHDSQQWDTSSPFSPEATFEPPVKNPAPRLAGLSMDSFQKYIDPATNPDGALPAVFTDLISDWPALNNSPWSRPAYLLSRTFGGRRYVPVELGRSYVDEGWSQKLIPFREFLSSYIDPSLSLDPADSPGSADERKGYLAQHDLFSQIPQLRNDVLLPDYLWTTPPLHPSPSQNKPKVDAPQLNAWFGPAGTITPLHTDSMHNLLCQVVGRKYVRLYPPECDAMCPRGVEGGVDMGNTSRVDVGVVEGWDEVTEGGGEISEKEAERFKGAEYWDCVLAPGDTVYVPIGWWHYVRSLSVSFSVSFWWN